MLCKLELMGIQEKAKMDYALEQKRLDEIAKQNYLKLVKQTISYCETEINDALLKRATDRLPIEFSQKVGLKEDRLGNLICYKINYGYKRYANGEASYYLDSEPFLAYDALIEYLNQHCINVKITNDSYKEYGYGTQKCIKIKIYISAE